MANPLRPNEVVVFWDSNMLLVTPDISIRGLCDHLNDLVKTVNPQFTLCKRGNVACGDILNCFTDVQKTHLKSKGFALEHAPERVHFCNACKGGDEVYQHEQVPELLLRCLMLGRAINRELPQNILIMSPDRNFRRTMKYLREAGYTVFLMKSVSSGDFGDEYTRAWNWDPSES